MVGPYTTGHLTDLRRLPGSLYVVAGINGDESAWVKVAKVPFLEGLKADGYNRVAWRVDGNDILFEAAWTEGTE